MSLRLHKVTCKVTSLHVDNTDDRCEFCNQAFHIGILRTFPNIVRPLEYRRDGQDE